jgi:hypothetical protein
MKFINIFNVFTLVVSFFALSPVSAADTSTWINWEDNKIISLLNNLLSITDNPCNKDTLNSIIDKITHNTGSLYIPLSFSIPIPLQRSSLNITGVTISGLDTLKEATLLEAVDKYSLYNHIEFDDLEIIMHGNAKKHEVVTKFPFYMEVTETFTYTVMNY